MHWNRKHCEAYNWGFDIQAEKFWKRILVYPVPLPPSSHIWSSTHCPYFTYFVMSNQRKIMLMKYWTTVDKKVDRNVIRRKFEATNACRLMCSVSKHRATCRIYSSLTSSSSYKCSLKDNFLEFLKKFGKSAGSTKSLTKFKSPVKPNTASCYVSLL